MIETLYEIIYVLLIATLVLNFAIGRIMRFINVGDAKILSPIIGTALGWLTFWIVPLSMAGIIVGAVATIVSNLILTNVVYPKLNEKANDVADRVDEIIEKKSTAAKATDFDRILFSSTAEERIKYLYRYMRHNNFYCFSYSADSVHVFNMVNEAIDKSSLRNEYPDVKKQICGDVPVQYLVFTIQGIQIVFVPATMQQREVYVLGIHRYDDNHLKLKERMDLEKQVGYLLDGLYMISSAAIKSIDAGCMVEMIPFSMA